MFRHTCPIHGMNLKPTSYTAKERKIITHHTEYTCDDCFALYFATHDVYSSFRNSFDEYLCQEGIAIHNIGSSFGIYYRKHYVQFKEYNISKHASFDMKSLVKDFKIAYPNGVPQLINLPYLYKMGSNKMWSWNEGNTMSFFKRLAFFKC